MYYQSQNITHEMNVANDWRDYLHWCKALKIDLDNPYNYFPKNLKAVHDRTYKDFQILEDKKAAAERKRQEALAKKRMEEVKALFQEMLNDADSDGRYLMKAKGLVLMVPESADDLRKEGRTNGNCVGTYVERVAKGETNILFIRKEDKPDKTFYTLEYKGGKIIQCREKGKCDMTPEVEDSSGIRQKVQGVQQRLRSEGK